MTIPTHKLQATLDLADALKARYKGIAYMQRNAYEIALFCLNHIGPIASQDIRVAAIVRGGVVDEIYSNIKGVTAEVVDFDDADENPETEILLTRRAGKILAQMHATEAGPVIA